MPLSGSFSVRLPQVATDILWWDKALASARLRLTRTLGADLRRLSAGYVDSSEILWADHEFHRHIFSISPANAYAYMRNQRNAAKMVLCTRFFQPIEKHSNLSPGTRTGVCKPRHTTGRNLAFTRFYLFIIAAYSFHSPGLCLSFRSNERNRCNAIPWTVSPSRWTVMRRYSVRSCHVDCVGRSNPRKFVPRISGITLPLPRIFSYRRPTWWRMSFASLFVRLSVRSPRWSIPAVFSAVWDPFGGNRSCYPILKHASVVLQPISISTGGGRYNCGSDSLRFGGICNLERSVCTSGIDFAIFKILKNWRTIALVGNSTSAIWLTPMAVDAPVHGNRSLVARSSAMKLEFDHVSTSVRHGIGFLSGRVRICAQPPSVRLILSDRM